MRECIQFADIQKTKVLSKSEERLLFELYSKGGQDAVYARNRLVVSNMRFVVHTALSYRNSFLSLSDLVSEGSIGLIQAIERFDCSSGYRFISYAVWWIRAYISSALRDFGNFIRIPANLHKPLRAAIKESSLGLEVSEEMRRLISVAATCADIDGELDGGRSYSDIIADENADNPEDFANQSMMSKIVNDIMSNIPESEREILTNYFGLGDTEQRTLREISRSTGAKYNALCKLKDSAISNFKKASRTCDAVYEFRKVG